MTQAAPQTPEKRRDPRKTRPTIGTREIMVHDKRPDRHYVLVYKAGQMGVDAYRDAGYEIERYRKDGPRIQGVRGEDKAAIETRGHVLMSISMHDAKALIAEQQAEVDLIEKAIVTQDIPADTFRGIKSVALGQIRYEDARNDPTDGV